MFYIYHGYCSPDNYDASDGPTYKLKEVQSPEEVVAFRLEFQEDLHDECNNIFFRVFEGKERFLQPKQVVQSYEWG
jgi:hypothetical protein